MKVLKLFIIGLLPYLAISCGVFIEKDISNESVALLSPGNGTNNDETTQRFSWEENEQIDQYRLQIVTSDFNNIRVTYHDTLVSSTRFSTNDLEPQEYEWRVRGETSSENTTDYITRSFRVDADNDISDLSVNLTSPSEGRVYSEGASILLDWSILEESTSYEVVIEVIESELYPSGGGESGLTETEYSVKASDLFDGEVAPDTDETDFETIPIEYEWYVIAKNDNFESLRSEVRKFIVNTKVLKIR